MKKLLFTILIAVSFLVTHAQSLCDSVVVFFNEIDTNTTPNLIHFDVQVFGYGPSIGYPGFILLNNLGDTVAYESFNTASNVFSLIPNSIETRFLDVVQNFSLPFNGFIHLVSGWFAGNVTTACIYPFNINNSTTYINETEKKKNILKITDISGRELDPNKSIGKTLLFYIFDNGSAESKIILE
tara:strand:+ start:257 stop:808 length:552 start_codon:yes stop_codon:yes gene_type:complete